MLLAMSDFCSRVVDRCDRSWGYIGWGLWAGRYVFSFLALYLLFSVGAIGFWLGIALGWACYVLWLLWWLIDAVDQQVALWQVVLGIIMLSFGFLPYYGGWLPLAAWVIYWTRIRE